MEEAPDNCQQHQQNKQSDSKLKPVYHIPKCGRVTISAGGITNGAEHKQQDAGNTIQTEKIYHQHGGEEKRENKNGCI
jgi:hypothetical protein